MNPDEEKKIDALESSAQILLEKRNARLREAIKYHNDMREFVCQLILRTDICCDLMNEFMGVDTEVKFMEKYLEDKD